MILKKINFDIYDVYDKGVLVKNRIRCIEAFEMLTNSKIEFKFEVNNKEVISSFIEDVLIYVFNYPNSFKVCEENKKYYTQRYLKSFEKLRTKCLLDGLNDIKIENNYVLEELDKRNYFHLKTNINKEIYNDSMNKKIPLYALDNEFYAYKDDSNDFEDYNYNAMQTFENYAIISFYYPYEIGEMHNHAHDFIYVLESAYYNYGNFNIKKENEENYSSSELDFINNIKIQAQKNESK